jgi:DNA-binding beta-propeller fold protein YncE
MRIAASRSAFWPSSSVLVCGLAAGLAGCTASGSDIHPPQDRVFFPTGLAVSPTGDFLFVANANSELRYDSGSISVIDLGIVRDTIEQWLEHPGQPLPSECGPDPDHSETLVCDETKVQDKTQSFFKQNAGVRIGNFATDLALQNFTDADANFTRVFVPTRGDPSISWADFATGTGTGTGTLSCTAGAETYPLCDDVHRLTFVANDPDQLPVPTEPFSVFADAHNGFAMVTHLTSGSVTLVRAPRDSRQVGVADVISGVFAPDPATGLSGASGIAGRNPATADDLVYVGGTSEGRIQTFTVGTRAGTAAFLLPGRYFFLDAVGGTNGNSSDTRGMQFSPSGDRLYVANRNPPTLQVYDTSLGPNGVPRNAATGASDLCRQVSGIAVLGADPGAGIDERVYVTCFEDGQIYVVDPSGQSQVEDIISVGRGPYSAAVLASSSGRKLLFVSNFLEDTIAVIDLDPGSLTRNRVVLRIGTPKAPS